MEAEISPAIMGEVRRTAFAISERHLLTAWHCVRGIHDGPLWFRLRGHDTSKPRHYAYIPVETSSIHEPLDVAVLRLDGGRLGDANLTDGEASAILTGAVISLGTRVDIWEQVRVAGFPMTAPSCDCDVYGCQVHAVAAQLGDVTCLKLFGPSFAAVDPADPHGLSGGPVLGLQPGSTEQPALEVAVGVIQAVPKGPASGPHTAVGGGLKLKCDAPESYRILHYPDLPLLVDYPTLGPQSDSPVRMNVNGKAGSLEMYLGRDLLTVNGELVPVQWTGYVEGQEVTRAQSFPGIKDVFRRSSNERLPPRSETRPSKLRKTGAVSRRSWTRS